MSAPRVEPRPSPSPTAVAALQLWFQASITHPAGLDAAQNDREVTALLPGDARRLDDLLEPSAQLTAAQRLEIYANAVFLRFRDVLQNDFPAVVAAIGHEPFTACVREYIERHPSTSFTLNDLGARFPDFLAGEATPPAVADSRPFLAELAQLERTVEELFHERHVEAALPAALAQLPPARWADARFTLIAAARLLQFRWPVDPWLQAVRDGASPPLPAAADSWLLVHRREWRVWRTRLSALQFRLLAALANGSRLGAALESAAQDEAEQTLLLGQVGRWFAEWTADGVFASITVDGAPPAR